MSHALRILCDRSKATAERITGLLSALTDTPYLMLSIENNKRVDTLQCFQKLQQAKADLLILKAAELPYPLADGLSLIALVKNGPLAISSLHLNNPLSQQLAIIARTSDQHLKELFAKEDQRDQYGKVSLVGFGPGNAEYLTLKGDAILKNADVVFYDDLIDKHYLEQLDAELVFVGKRRKNHSKEQYQINELLYRAALSGKNTVRLKGGDPAIFGRASEEIDFLNQRFIETEIVPGITTASAAAALSGLSLTKRGVSQSVAFVTGHRPDINLPKADTMVFYMAATHFHTLAQRLIEEGRNPDTPVVICSHVAMPNQQDQVFSLQEMTHKKQIAMPAIIIVSPIIQKEDLIHYRKRYANILVPGQETKKFEKLGKLLHTPLYNYSFNRMHSPDLNKVLHSDSILFMDKHCVHYLLHYLQIQQTDLRQLAGKELIVLNADTADALNTYGLQADVVWDLQHKQNGTKTSSFNKATLLLHASHEQAEHLESFTGSAQKISFWPIYSAKPASFYTRSPLEEIHTIAFDNRACIAHFFAVYGALPEHINIHLAHESLRSSLTDYQNKYSRDACKELVI